MSQLWALSILVPTGPIGMLKDFPFYTWPNQIERRNLFLSLFSPMPDVKTTRWPARMNQVLIMVKAWCAGFCSGYLKEGSLRELLSGMALITVPYVLTETVSRISRAWCSFFSSFLSFLLPLYLPFPFLLSFSFLFISPPFLLLLLIICLLHLLFSLSLFLWCCYLPCTG